MKKAQMYLKMKELREAREKGLDLEEYKAKLKNGTDFTTSRGGSPNDMSNISDNINTKGAEKEYGPKKGYKKFVGSKGSLDSRLRNVIAYKRSSMASNELIRNSDSGMTENEERELDEMMEDDYDDDEFDFDFDEEEAEYEQAILKAIEMNKLNELKRNFAMDSNVYDKAMEKRIDGDDENSGSDSGSGNATTTATGLMCPCLQQVLQAGRNIWERMMATMKRKLTLRREAPPRRSCTSPSAPPGECSSACGHQQDVPWRSRADEAGDGQDG